MESLIHGVGDPTTLHVPLHLRVSDQISVTHQDGPRPHGLRAGKSMIERCFERYSRVTFRLTLLSFDPGDWQ
jgi:hypothetical protein